MIQCARYVPALFSPTEMRCACIGQVNKQGTSTVTLLLHVYAIITTRHILQQSTSLSPPAYLCHSSKTPSLFLALVARCYHSACTSAAETSLAFHISSLHTKFHCHIVSPRYVLPSDLEVSSFLRRRETEGGFAEE